MSQSPWNSLERTKLFVQALTPITAAVIAAFFALNLSKQNSLADRRLKTYDMVSAELNQIYCFIEEVGDWKKDDPEKIITLKRLVDQAMHRHRAIWREQTFQAYLTYMDSAYETYRGDGKDPQIRARNSLGRQAILNWKPEWKDSLTGNRDPSHKENYEKMQAHFSEDLRWK